MFARRLGLAVCAALAASSCAGPAQPPAGGASPTSTDSPGGPTATGAGATQMPPVRDPTPTPDGTKPGDVPGAPTGELPMGRLVWDSDRAGSVDIWMLDAGAAEPQQITTHEAIDRVATLSADGTRIVFSSVRNGGPDSPTGLRSYALFSISPGDAEPQHLLGTRTYNSSAVYSPDGSQIAFSSDAEPNLQVFVMSADGSGSPTQLTDDDVQAEMGDWSPDGSQIVFTSLRDSTGCSETPRDVVVCTEYNREIYVMNADGSDQARLTDDPADDSSPSWSPDGTQIVFDSDRAGNDDIYVMNADGSDVRQLTSGAADEGFPTWSPDGSMIAFHYFLDEDHDEIYLMNADGSGVVNLTSSPSRDAFPNWGPLPE